MMDTIIQDPYPECFLGLLKKKGLDYDTFIKSRQPNNLLEFERGEIREYEFFRNYYLHDLDSESKKILPRPQKIKHLLFSNMRFINGMDDLLLELKDAKDRENRFSMGIASNYSPWYSLILDQHKILDESMDFHFFSCEMACRKPDRAYYSLISESLEKHYGTKDLRIMFVDDRPQNLEGAKKLGWDTILMGDVKRLSQELFDFINSK